MDSSGNSHVEHRDGKRSALWIRTDNKACYLALDAPYTVLASLTLRKRKIVRLVFDLLGVFSFISLLTFVFGQMLVYTQEGLTPRLCSETVRCEVGAGAASRSLSATVWATPASLKPSSVPLAEEGERLDEVVTPFPSSISHSLASSLAIVPGQIDISYQRGCMAHQPTFVQVHNLASQTLIWWQDDGNGLHGLRVVSPGQAYLLRPGQMARAAIYCSAGSVAGSYQLQLLSNVGSVFLSIRIIA